MDFARRTIFMLFQAGFAGRACRIVAMRTD
jgi:hypothetical protein